MADEDRSGAFQVWIEADDPLVASALSSLIADGGALAADDASSADLILWDAGPSWDRAPDSVVAAAVPVVALIADIDDAGAALAAGAHSAILRTHPSASVAAALRATYHGFAVTEPVESATPFATGKRRPLQDLTPREQQVLGLLARALPNRAIAAQLDISEHTAKFHVNSILDKLDARTRTEAVVIAARLGLVSL